MDHRGQPMYGDPRMSIMEQSYIDSVPGSIPIENLVGNNSQETMVIQGEPMSDNHATFTHKIQGEPMSDNHATFTHKTHLIKMPVQQNYSQLPLRKEVDEEGRICGVVLPETLDQVTKEENNFELEDAPQEEIKTEEEDISYFMESAHDIFLKISRKELKIKAAADILERPYSFVYSRYQEFLDNVDEEVIPEKKKRKEAKIRKNGKKVKRAKKMNWGGASNKTRKRLKCDECPGVFPTEYRLRIHMKLHEEENESLECTLCGIIFAKITQLMHHRIDVHEEALQCPHCDATFTIVTSYRTHVRSHSTERPFVCKECGKGYLVKTHLDDHIRTHTGERPFMCGYCERAFFTMSNLKGHVKKVHADGRQRVYNTGDPKVQKEKKWECEQCGKRFVCQSALNEHMNVHTGAKPYACDMCDARFNHKSAVNLHRMKHTGEKPKKRILGLGPRIKEKKFNCEQCDRKYTSHSALLQHMNIHTGAMPYACDMCDERFNFKQGLKNHKMTHTGVEPYKCDLCPVGFYKKKGLEQHKLIHSGLKPFKCDLCDFSCKRKESLEYHKNTHTGETPFKCDFYGCTAEYAKPGSLRNHKMKHGQPPKTCKFCHEKFQDLTSLKRHMMIHTGEKPIQCDQCSKIFYEKSSLKRHMYSHMDLPAGNKTKQIRQSRKNPVPKKTGIALSVPQKTWEPNITEYQVPLAENGHNIFVPTLTATVQNTNNQQTFHHFTASQYSTMVNNSWPTTIDPDELRHRLLSSFK